MGQVAFGSFLENKKSPVLGRGPSNAQLLASFCSTDECPHKAMGAVLSQERDGMEWPITYTSQKLSPQEQRYATIEQECLAG